MANKRKEIGWAGLDEWSGIIREDFLKELRGKDGYKRYNEMRLNSSIIGGMLLAIEQAIRGIDWNFNSDQGEEDERVVFLDEALAGMSHSWNDHIIEALTMLPFGYAPFEIVYERQDGRLTWRKFAIRGQDTLYKWELDDAGGMEGFWQQAPPYNVPVLIPIEKMVIYRTRVEKNNPEGRSILRNAWVSYYYAKNLMQIEAIGIERDLAGLPIITLPESATTDENDSSSDAYKAAEIVRNIRNDEQAGLVKPFGWEFELASTGGSRQFDTDTIIKRYESRMLMSALAQFLILGQDKVGTQALSTDFTDFFAMSVNATADIIAETFTKFAAQKLLELNGMDTEGISMEHSPAGDTDLTTFSEAFMNIAPFITLFPQDETWIRSIYGMPEIDEDAIIEEKEAAAQQAQAMARQMQQRPQNDDEQMVAEVFAADNAPDDKQRRLWEGRYDRLWRTYLSGQEKRVIKGAKGLKRG